MRDRVALACFALACLVSVGAAVLNLASGDHGAFWLFVVMLCFCLLLFALQLRHVRRQRLRTGKRP